MREPMTRAGHHVHLIHWNAEECRERIARLEEAGYRVTGSHEADPASIRRLRESAPAAVVIDLSRLPSQGRDVALSLRQTRKTRTLPIIFVGGEPDKVARIRALLPDATYTRWGQIHSALLRAISSRPAKGDGPAVRPFDAYAGTPVPRKLGIAPGSVVLLLRAPAGFESTLAGQGLPEGVQFRRRVSARSHDLTIWFVRSIRDLEDGIARVASAIGTRGLWIAWRKRGSGLAALVTQVDVRRIGLAAGLVDYKICSIDSVWSGLKFTRRR